jgi:uncharacterized membrane protein YoaT (DUF817 family)
MRAFLGEFLVFGLMEARACIFAASFFGLLIISRHIPLFGLPRYDFLCLAAIGIQIVLLRLGIETKEELLVLCAFHAVGLVLELFKTSPAIASWAYPEFGYLKLRTVPLYSGFMYAAVASYMCQAWRILKLELVGYPSYRKSVPLAAAIYLNFFTKHYVPDVRWLLLALVFLVFRKTWVRFTVLTVRRSMPLALSFALIGFFIWIAENFSTYMGAYVYPHQNGSWQVVSFRIMSSWFLLVIVSFIIVADLKHVRGSAGVEEEEAGAEHAGAIQALRVRMDLGSRELQVSGEQARTRGRGPGSRP